MDLTLNEVLKAIDGELLIKNNEGNFEKISTDTRKIDKNSLFIALKGNNFNGNNYVVEAIKAGATVAIIDEVNFKLEELNGKGTVIKVNDSKTALGALAKYYREKLGIKVVGITGSTGKTSTKDLVAAFLSGKYSVFKTKGNFNNEIGLPLMIFELDSSYDIAVLEMGTNNFNEIHRLANIARPDMAIITNVGVSHIEYLKTRENILKEKFSITDFFKKNNTLVVNYENDMLQKVNESNEFKIEKIGYDKKYDLYAENIELTEESTSFDAVNSNGERHRFKLNMVGEHNILNALLGIRISENFGITFEEMELGLNNFEATSMRLEFIKKNNFTIINDCYNASPDSMKSALSVLKTYSGSRKIAVLGDMGELGEHAKSSHEMVGQDAIGKADIVLTTGEFREDYKSGFGKDTVTFNCKEELKNYLCNLIKDGDVILVKASRSAKFEDIVKNIEAL
ncbi:UDP-N-acetylmuramoyl-tripeptide--D-alanyl-D-alanine ligase [Clostridium botulinum]|uniref:UDP-N-acetylmuramoyl-tripeptide--D-alanyl-D-alanine ligase n=1 Tax=Clostridium botulinum (strain Eklund 17B / Type B) TaxID=935198 RepID=B2TS26_CLOBB|nr:MULTISPECIES: UDP-N-acetylmuramoyl-tripeptide--D-alanyl-D-alanine ligase [unclassified Clostridium]ACD24494.1 UDP-N-acetylmuramoyl-tripeptide--D-alanyl-D-alanine ligase [Clostridium botulinum B str. Eklund 17B (NRP)]MBN1052697.1 UDP-N-acetylmuramoyl-tripeptide--D-alanyl-D-alanine ligase [Clostridium botulinum]MBY6975964.1 UDP-N-acetylmuramoyl-tripeptide--D-alanyl-D-alanine ligase [Clostridium botulinum]MBY7000387.1 UDP-N-acetylmuramoyl-tripeptide--D-alanyl-D-alanine ligase [Clostridium botul